MSFGTGSVVAGSSAHPHAFCFHCTCFLLLPQQELVVFIIIDCIGKPKELIAELITQCLKRRPHFFSPPPRLVSPFPCPVSVCLELYNVKRDRRQVQLTMST
jgi:hypothetical protein